MTPQVNFRYSWIYDQTWQNWLRLQFKEEELNFRTQDQIEDFITEITPMWREVESKILTEISAVTSLPWTEGKVTCYIVAHCREISEPLTMHPLKDRNLFIRRLIHEMIHQNHIQGGMEGRWPKIWKAITEKYPNENIVTQIHIPVHAALKHILLKFYGQSWVDADIGDCKKDSYYTRAWEIVEQEGYENINKAFVDTAR